MESWEIVLSFRRISKRLTEERERLHGEAYAKKIERQEEPPEEQESSKGGEGSGNFGHEGRPGEVGGSGGGGGGSFDADSWLSGNKSKGLTPDQKKLHWENYVKTTERQEEVFKKVFDNVFNEQKNQVIAEIKRTGKLPPLDDSKTAKKFQPAIELVYHSAFEGAV